MIWWAVFSFWWVLPFTLMVNYRRVSRDISVGDVICFGGLSLIGPVITLFILCVWLEPYAKNIVRKKVLSKKKGTNGKHNSNIAR